MRNRSSGFTLIEMLVVIGIISLLAVALLPQIIGARERANQVADAGNLRWHYQTILLYQQKHGQFPRGSGHQWVLDPWVRGDVERTPQNFDRYFTPGLDNQYKRGLLEEGVDNIWKDRNSLISLDTDYAGRGSHSQIRKLDSGRVPWMANDNEGDIVFIDGSINVLMGDGTVLTLYIDPDFLEYGWTTDMVDEPFPVGPDSPHPLLRQLAK